jgi:hypothetical protein
MKLLLKALLGIIIYIGFTVVALARTFGEVSNTLFSGVNVLTKFFWAGCILIGIFLLVGSLINYQSHRNNPKLVPMATVITYLFLGILTISIPFLNKLFGADSYDSAQQSTIIR